MQPELTPIRNLTPFPLRDSFTSSLSHPLDLARTTTDDIASVLSRKRSRKSSTRPTLNGIFEGDVVVQSRGRTSSTSTVTLPNAPTSASPASIVSSPPRSTHSVRILRPRTNSTTSVNSSLPAYATRSFLPDNSQAALQNIIASRLVQTFITISIPANTPPQQDKLQPLRSAPMSKASSRTPKTVPDTSSSFKPSHRSPASPPDSAPPFKTSFKTPIPNKNGTARAKPSSASRPNGAPSPSTSPRFDPKGKSPAIPFKEIDFQPPVYFSPIHRPSTNPFFPIDARSPRDFPPPCDVSGQRLRIEVWGKATHDLPRRGHHQATLSSLDNEHHGWTLLDEWDFELNQLLPLPDDVDTNPSSLPSNSLLVTLSPPGEVLYLPPSTSTISRSSSPSAGYTSDPESEIRKAKQVGDYSVGDSEILPLSRRRRRKRINSTAGSRDTSKTAGWQELFKLVTLQSCVLDNEASVNEVIRGIDGLLEDDGAFSQRRQISEREARLQDLKRNRDIVLDQSAKRRAEIVAHKQRLQQRSELLESARKAFDMNSDLNQTIADERSQLMTLYENMNSIRTSLLSTLSTIFPIELLSPPDLLFTILDVPLPIPVNSNDPAPPLTLPEHKEVTEEAVAAALGFVAQVLQILAAYIGKNLTYPVTCIGSRSLIRDGISAMVGPRMFPLFSKGVDTYRFEYGVFLLNKDIEMAKRDLRALDIRHSLPNLKNLMLTLSHDNAPTTTIRPIKRSHSPISMTSGLETPSRASSPTNEDLSTPKASQIIGPNGTDPITLSTSGATTPTASSDESRKPKSFLGFVPFTDFLRGRYPSATQASDKKADDDDDNQSLTDSDAASNADLDEDDRRTIHGVASGISGGPSHLNDEFASEEEGELIDASV
ncbi:hypothetical protein CVT25_005993 [Psilocybe cyanescens]|uniref:UV radiation resistance-associated gene protein n=1 Tax=Psilocybe cyanescens TaxID=93625 RepID=A0A409VMB1_PSICY|nr:hypothetical protein CVT25_005993 [Psilocybe cyanescens]